MVTWISWALVALGLALVTLAVMSVSGRLRPARRALRRLSWRREDLARLRTRAEAVQARVDELAVHARDVAASRAGHAEQPPTGGDST